MIRRASSAASWKVHSTSSTTFFERCLRTRWRERTRSTTNAVPALTPTTAAAAGLTQLRGSRMALSSQESSSSWASSVRLTSVSSTRSTRCSGGSTGVSAWRRRASKSAAPLLIGTLLRAGSPGPSFRVPHGLGDHALELTDRAVQEHLGRAVGAPECPGDLPVVHAKSEAHDQRLAAIVGELLDAVEDRLELLAPLHQRLRGVRGRDHVGVLDPRLRLARPVAIEVRRQVVGDPDE